ncbi:MAG: hypothetical protein LIP09_04145 [Bacteroidales bacterium]|nr:hypothetical protein [Bacteroidales bacterium]
MQNLTDQTIYLDLANTFIIDNGKSTSLFVPSATSVSTSKSTGGSVNLGSVANAVGVGGAVGTIANGVNVGGGSSNTSTTVTYSQRVVAIPPHSCVQLQNSWLWGLDGLNPGMTIGEVRYFTEANSPCQTGYYITYGFDENISQPMTLSQNYYLYKLIGLNGGLLGSINMRHLSDVNLNVLTTASCTMEK